MGRVTVWVPDELLDRARALNQSENTSQLVREGLQRLIGEETSLPSYARKPEQSFDRIVEVRDRLLAEAREDYEFGYTIAIEAASAMPLHVINALVDSNFDLPAWLAPFESALRHELIQGARLTAGTDSLTEILEEIREDARASDDTASPSQDIHRRDPWWWLWKSAEALGELADPIGYDRYGFTPTKPRLRGYADAMRELWAALEEPDSKPSDAPHNVGVMETERQRKSGDEAATGGGGDEDRTDDEDDS